MSSRSRLESLIFIRAKIQQFHLKADMSNRKSVTGPGPFIWKNINLSVNSSSGESFCVTESIQATIEH